MDDTQRIQLIASNLKSSTKLHIIQYLSKKEASNQEIFEALQSSLNINYRSAFYAALKDLQNSGLIVKYYDNIDNKIKYRLVVKIVHIDFENMKLTLS